MKLFNKQRFALVNTSDFKKYLKYAFGEIVLVVIGILIAVSINNWNQHRKLQSANTELRMNVIKQLDKEIAFISSYQKELDTMQKNYMRYLQQFNKSEPTISGEVLGSLLFQLNTLDADSQVITMIDNAALNQSKASELLLNLSSNYKDYVEEMKSIERLIFTTITENLKEIERTQDWYVDFVTSLDCEDECMYYFFNDKRHRARIASLRFLYMNSYGGLVSTLKSDLIDYRKDLKAVKE
ncbi:MAG: DUF6090 family protein [Bacteroidota bacterium]